MRYGVTLMLTDRSMRPDELAREVEAHGFDSLYLPEHTHIPTARATPAPMGEPLPESYQRLLDPFVALTAAAAATSRLRVGTGVCLVAERDPIVTAKEVASVDLLSDGRFVFGVGFGWNREELAHHGVAYEDRRAVVLERLALMRALWTQDEASFDGERISLEPSWQWPKPVQSPHPPVLFGVGAGERSVRLLVEHADGWIPIGGRGLTDALPRVRGALEEAGRDPSSFDVVPFGSTPDVAKFDHFRDIGCTEVVTNLPSGVRDEIMPALAAAAEVVGALR
ncbi:MAG: LLM class F420-dependent oxidoreductase [Actinobacteria bacterium]|nr:LLM class F420-dependent oxidoreductase [Actinomycetota bacterium]